MRRNDIIIGMGTAIKKIELEFHFLSVELSSAVNLHKNSNHLVGIDLVCPRSTVNRKSSNRTVTLEKGVFAPEAPSWTDSVIFKESVEGRFGIEVTVTEPISDAIADYFIKNAASSLVKILAGFMSKDIAIKGLDDIAEVPLATLSKTILKDKSPDVIFRGCTDLHSGEDFSKQVVVTIPLRATKDISISITRPGKSNDTVRKTILKKGETAGTCKIALQLVQ